MTTQISVRHLSEVLNFEELSSLFRHFSNLTGIDVALCDVEGREVLSNRLRPEQNICEYMKKIGKNQSCIAHMAYSGKKAAELGGTYIFKCGNMIKSSASILFEEKLIGSLSCGPVLLWDVDEYSLSEMTNWAVEHEVSAENMDLFLKNTKQLSCETMTSAAKMLAMMVDLMCKEESRYLSQREKISQQQKEISELIQEKKLNALSLDALERKAKFRKFPIEMERELIASMRVGKITNAKRILNDILSEIFSVSSGNLDIIKSRLFELSAILMRAGVDNGASLLDMSKIIIDFSKILNQEISFEEMCLITSDTMETIILAIAKNPDNRRRNEKLINALEYIKQNYHQDLSLGLVSKKVYVSSYYLSHLFRDELNMTFSDYVNKVRME
ncbi:MAG: AraC family transcriptional regulator, partial [Acholeplasmataceae bacterium]|nr:AraC family transcriptional regulator [Acholeplasmataceae bacterium]